MNAQQIFTVFLVLLIVQLSLEIFLDILNLKNVKAHASSVPDVFAKTIDNETYQKSVAYTLEKGRLGIYSTLVSTVALLLFILFGVFGWLDDLLFNQHLAWYWHGIFFVFGITLLFSLVNIPLELYSVFSIEERFGFNKMTLLQWAADHLKGICISFIIITPLLACLFWFIDNAGEYWWVYGLAFVTIFQLLISYLFPVLIAPLFNKFTPLGEGELKERINAMANKAGFKTSGVFSMDGSKRSSHANAYFTGFGRIKRIVLFDTLISLLTPPQTVAVLAHEIGHAKKHHIKKMMCFSIVFTCIGFWILSKVIVYTPLFEAFGFTRVSNHAALVIFTFASSPVTYFLGPLFSILSRRFEYQADKFAIDTVGNNIDLAQALLALSKKSLSNLTPHPWYSFFHYSHPTLHERLTAIANAIAVSEPLRGTGATKGSI